MIKKLRENISIFRLVLVLLTLVTVLNSEIDNHHRQILYAGYLEVPLYLLFFIIYLVVVIFDVILYFKTKRIKSLFPSIIGCILIIASFSVHFYHNDKMLQKTIFAAKSNWVDYETSNIMYVFEFKEGNNLLVNELIDQGLLTNFYYGTYTQRDSIFILNIDPTEMDISNRFLVRKVNANGFSEKELVQVDENGKEIKNQFQFIIDSYGRFETNRKNDSRAESSLTPEILGKWLVVDASTIPFDHISFCKNLSINSVFEFTADSTLKVLDSNTGDYCNLELTQYFSFKENTLHITEYDMIFKYQVNLLTQDSLILKINSIPQRFITEAMELGEMRDKEVQDIYENGILVTLTRIKNGE